jgi:hypothetical protein
MQRAARSAQHAARSTQHAARSSQPPQDAARSHPSTRRAGRRTHPRGRRSPAPAAPPPAQASSPPAPKPPRPRYTAPVAQGAGRPRWWPELQAWRPALACTAPRSCTVGLQENSGSKWMIYRQGHEFPALFQIIYWFQHEFPGFSMVGTAPRSCKPEARAVQPVLDTPTLQAGGLGSAPSGPKVQKPWPTPLSARCPSNRGGRLRGGLPPLY